MSARQIRLLCREIITSVSQYLRNPRMCQHIKKCLSPYIYLLLKLQCILTPSLAYCFRVYFNSFYKHALGKNWALSMFYQERELGKLKRKYVSRLKIQPKYTHQSVRKIPPLEVFTFPSVFAELNCEKKGDTKIEN